MDNQQLNKLREKAKAGNKDDIYNLADFLVKQGLACQNGSAEFNQNLLEAYSVLKNSNIESDDKVNYLKYKIEDNLNINNNGLDSLIAAAELGNSEAQYQAGIHFQFEEPDIKKAVTFYEMAAQNNHLSALNQLWMIFNGSSATVGIQKDFKRAIKYLKRMAELGNSKAQLLYGLSFEDSDPEVRISNKEALKWFKKALENGNTEANIWIGLIYNNGLIDEPDFAKAKPYLEKAIEDADMSGPFLMLAQHYIDGIDIAQDFNKAEEILEKGTKCKEFNVLALEKLYKLFLEPFSLVHGSRKYNDKNHKKLIYWAQQYYNHPEVKNKDSVYFAIINAYYELFNETDYSPSDEEKRDYLFWLELGEKENNILAKAFLGFELITGNYIQENVDEGFNLLNSAIMNDHSREAAILLHLLFREGAPNFPINYDQAMNCFQITDLQNSEGFDAFELNEGRQWYEIGKFFLDPKYGVQDIEAFDCLNLAAMLGSDKAKNDMVKYLNMYNLNTVPKEKS